MSDKKIVMNLETIMGDRFGKYSKYIIQDRALPDVRDGLKPVQRRILYSMNKEGNIASKPYRKSAKTVGNVIGNYHPHGDTSVYDAMVRLSQEWKIRAPLIDMQGNNGSIDNDPPAAMRYTEARLSPIASELLKDLDKETVLMSLNFDDTEYEPTVLPAAYPNLLVNGATGISAGYATDIPPHNLMEVIDATIYRIRYPHCHLDKLMEFIKGPDFPTGAIVEGLDGIKSAFTKGKGKVIVRAKTEIVEQKNMNQIIITEIPYEVNKADLVRKIDEIRFNRNIDGILEVRDESDREGLRIAIDLKKTVNVENTLNYFFKNTDLQKNYNYNMVAIRNKRPELMGIIDIIDGYIDHRIDVVTRSSLYDLKKAKDRLHIVDGLIKAISILDDVVKTIRHSQNKADAKTNLINQYGFTDRQAEAIVMLQLYRLTNTDIVALEKEKEELDLKINQLNEILDSDEVLRKVIITQLKEIKKKYPMPRLTQIKEQISDIRIDEKAMIIEEDINVSVTRDGYIKRISQRSIKASTGIPFGKKEDDILIAMYAASTIDHLLLFTNKGNYLFVPLHKIEEFKWKDIGKHISYLIKVAADEKIITAMLIKDFSLPLYVLLATRNGQIKRTALKDFEVQRYSKAMKCMSLKDDDEVIAAHLTNNQQGILIATKAGYGAIYSEQEVSILGVKAAGIKALNIKGDCVVAVETFDPLTNNSVILMNTEGQIKRLKLMDIPTCKRTNKGTILYKNLKTKTIYLYNALVVNNHDEMTAVTSLQNNYSYVATDFNYGSLQSRFVSFISLEKEEKIVMNRISHDITTDDFAIEPKKSSQINALEIKAENTPTLLDDFDIDTSKPKPKTVNTKQKKEETHYEKISLADILNEDDF
ncbi:DNA topoisomerase IV subunit A [[Clostridium] spiroforme]|nr:DNA topoisomerase IV subunit A [Thomasclavelia spiroformis]MBM6879794.1 DNA topoisomerase IV subunit A [Thomasclavelia spiroformis]